MPSYYDSKKQKPSKAKVKYNAGGRTKTAGGFKKRRKPKTSKSRLVAMDRPLQPTTPARGMQKEGSTRSTPMTRAAKLRIKEHNRPSREKALGAGTRQEMNRRRRELVDEIRAEQFNQSAAKSRLGAMDRPLYKIVEIDGVPKVVEKAYGGQVKKMKGGGTVARGSGAARPQTFRKNG
jgi:hypothetical protein